MERDHILKGFVAVICLFILTVAIAGCTDVTYNIENPAAPTTQADQFEVTRDVLDAYLASGAGPIITATALFDNLNDGDTSNDPVVISCRSSADYETGHIPGAINISWKEIANASSLAKITAGKDVVCYCYTGHTGAVAATVLNALGYDAQNLKFGMMTWTTDADVRVKSPFVDGVDSHDFPVETTPNTLPPTQALNTIDNTTSQDDYEIIRAAAESYVAGTLPPVITAQALFDNLNDGDTSNDPVIISARSADDYAKGHIPGAINIPWTNSALISSLKQIPPDAEVVYYCYTGHTGGIATTVLNMLGYSTKNLMWGMCSWTEDPDVRVKGCYTEDQANDYAYTTGPNP